MKKNRTEVTPLTVAVTVRPSSLNSRTMVTGLSPFCTCTSLLSPSLVTEVCTFFPSARSSSNSSPSLNLISLFFSVELVLMV
ncbi:hypothetical protein TYRP_016573 [Tyrophagus putrescentiae]|nr:hypothetical protein TYRP_016573 [Tyrophagus putrescentiae]